jgi:molybdopterin-containing oxidoreductase family membrane subunit
VIFWVQFYLIGIFIPVFILLNKGTRNKISWILIASACHVVGVLGERILFILPGQVLAVPTLTGYEFSSPFLDGEIVNYFPQPVEWMQVVGIFALLGLIYMLGIRILPLLPVQADYIAPVSSFADKEEVIEAVVEEEGEAEEGTDTAPAAAEE